MRVQPMIAALLAVTMLAPGCSSIREIPRASLIDLPEQRDVVVDLRSGEHYEFDTARFGPDSLWGFRRSEDEGSIAEVSTTPLELDAVARVAARRLDWYRTGLAAVSVIGSGVAFAVSQRRSSSGGDGTPVKPPPAVVSGHGR